MLGHSPHHVDCDAAPEVPTHKLAAESVLGAGGHAPCF
jgi:hypothetical protein